MMFNSDIVTTIVVTIMYLIKYIEILYLKGDWNNNGRKLINE